MSQVKILVIADDEGSTESIKYMLDDAAPQIIAAIPGEEGIELVKKQNPDLIILDLIRPDKNNWEVCTTVRMFSQAPILIYSAADSPGIIVEALNVGADYYLTKPVSSNILTAHLNQLLRRTRSAPASLSLPASL